MREAASCSAVDAPAPPDADAPAPPDADGTAAGAEDAAGREATVGAGEGEDTPAGAASVGWPLIARLKLVTLRASEAGSGSCIL